MKKLASLILALAIIGTSATAAFADGTKAEEIPAGAKITVAVQEETPDENTVAEAEDETEEEKKEEEEITQDTEEAVTDDAPEEEAPEADEKAPNDEEGKEEVPEIGDIVEDFENGELGDEYYDGVLENGEIIDTEEEMSGFEKYLETVGLAVAYGAELVVIGVTAPITVPVLSIAFVPLAPFALVLGVGMGACITVCGIATIVTSPLAPLIWE